MSQLLVQVQCPSVRLETAANIATQGAFTLDGAAASTGSVTLTGVTAGGNLTISMVPAEGHAYVG